MDQYVGQVLLAGFNYAPQGWRFCDGSLLPIDQFSVLFNLIGTTYGGDGVSTFALPDMRGRTAIGQGTGQGLSPAIMGQRAGAEFVTITAQTYPQHSHSLAATSDTGNAQNPSGSIVASGQVVYKTEVPTLTMNPVMCGPAAGLSNPHENRQPYQVCNWIIAVEGLFPPRT